MLTSWTGATQWRWMTCPASWTSHGTSIYLHLPRQRPVGIPDDQRRKYRREANPDEQNDLWFPHPWLQVRQSVRSKAYYFHWKKYVRILKLTIFMLSQAKYIIHSNFLERIETFFSLKDNFSINTFTDGTWCWAWQSVGSSVPSTQSRCPSQMALSGKHWPKSHLKRPGPLQSDVVGPGVGSKDSQPISSLLSKNCNLCLFISNSAQLNVWIYKQHIFKSYPRVQYKIHVIVKITEINKTWWQYNNFRSEDSASWISLILNLSFEISIVKIKYAN